MDFRTARMGTRKEPPSVLNSIKSLYSSCLMGRKMTSIFQDMPADRMMVSGKSIEKKRVSGSL